MQLEPRELEARLRPLFEENFTRFGELGAAVSVWQYGREIVSLAGGFRDARREIPWTADTLVLIWSATKGLASACILHAIQEHGISLDRRVAEFWPEFAQADKSRITLAQLLSHQAGLPALDEVADVLDYPAVIAAVENQPPLWLADAGHGYHARTFGFLADELTRRIAGKALSHYWRDTFAEPLALDIWIGLPEEQNERVATIYAARAKPSNVDDDFYRALTEAGSLARQAFGSPRGLHAVSAMNASAVRSVSLPSFGGIADARSLGKFYSMLANGGEFDGCRFFAQDTIGLMAQTIVAGSDRVFRIPTAFSAGFMKDPPQRKRRIFGPGALSFGHPGAGGSHAFADPENGLAFAYVMNQMEQGILPNEKALRLVDALYA